MPHATQRRTFAVKIQAILLVLLGLPGIAFSETNPLTQKSIQQLLDMEITSVSKSAQTLSQTPSAIFVIDQEDIRRSGARNIPDLLRMVPGADVAQISAHQWAVSIRGFNGALANKLLVLIDGRSVYTPLYAGVYWDTEDTLLEDIDRIEVIRGPGASVWGSNAVNGVINIITKNAKDTVGSLVTAGGGSEERGFGSYRYGDAIGEDGHYRVYGKYSNRDNSFNGNDSWNQGRAGFRADWDTSEQDQWMLQGGYYNGEDDLRGTDVSATPPFSLPYVDDEIVYGGHALARWSRTEASDRGSNLQMYYIQTHRDQRIFQEDRYTLDIDWDNRFPIAERHEFMWGAGYRMMHDDTAGDLTARFVPPDKTEHLFSLFVQDEITLKDDELWLTLGSKFEHNDYSGFEYQPSARLSWQMTSQQMVWGAVSRAVRIPTRFDHDLDVSGWTAPGSTLVRLLGDSGKQSEELMAYELGYRLQPNEDWFFDVTGFFNHYDNLTTATRGVPFAAAITPSFTVIPLYVDDNMHGDTYGGELSVQYQALSNWRLIAAYSFLEMDLHSTNDFLNQEASTEGSSPKNQVNLRSVVDLTQNLEFDSQVRYVDSLTAPNADSYVEVDLRLGWHVTQDFELSVVGQNLLDNHHVELANKNNPNAPQVERSVYGKLTWSF